MGGTDSVGGGQRRVLGRRVLLVGSMLVSAGVLAGGATPSLAASSRSPNVTATRSYLQAGYELVQAELADAPAANAAVQQLATTIGSECSGVLREAPPEPPAGSPFQRSVGESIRGEEQLQELESEASGALDVSYVQAARQAILAFAATLRSLHWGTAVLTAAALSRAGELESRLAAVIPDACGDIKSWVASGYRTLPATTRAFNSRRKLESARTPSQTFSSRLAPYEDAAGKALIAKTQALEKHLVRAAEGFQAWAQGMEAALGIEHPEQATFSHHPPGSVVVGKGPTAAGGRYEVLLEPPREHPRRREGECAPDHPVRLQLISNLGTGVSGCWSPAQTGAPPDLSCTEGLWTITLQTLPTAAEVRLTMSNGRSFTSHVAFVPPQLGGPVGFYYQVVRGPAPLPASLTELDEHDTTLRVLKLHPFKGCIKHLLKFLPGGIRSLAHDRVPGGPSFSIQGEAYRFLGRIHFALSVRIKHGGGGSESPSGRKPNVFTSATFTGCQPQPYAIVYGLLKQTSDAVFARTARGRLHALRRVTIPGHLHAPGVLVYLGSRSVPEELIVRNPSGGTVVTEKLSSLAREARERCVGEAEGGSGASAS